MADVYLGTVEGNAVMGKQLQQDLGIENPKKGASFSWALRRALSKGNNRQSGLEARIAGYRKNRRLKGYYLRATNLDDTEQVAIAATIPEITQKIKEIKLALLRTIQQANEEQNALEIEDSERQKVLEAIEDIRQEVVKAMALARNGFKEDTKTLIKTLLKASERGEAIMIPSVAKKIKPTIKDIRSLESAVRSLDTRGQHHMIRVQQDYLAKLRRIIQIASREIKEATDIVPEYLTTQLYSV